MSAPDIQDSIPNLQDICTEVVSCHDYWIVQKRHLQYLPQHTANRLLQLLLQRGRLQSPALLDVFRHSVTALHIDAKQLGLQIGAEWIAYIAGLSHLQQLSLKYSTRLKDKHLSPLTRLSGCLTSLDITGCSSLTNKTCAEVLGTLTSLQSLVLTGTGIRPPILTHLTSVSSLTHLDLGGLGVSNHDMTCHITTFRNLQILNLWGSWIEDSSVKYLLQLPDLRQLSMGWSKIRYVIPLHNNLTMLDLSHCQLQFNWQAAEGLFEGARKMKLQELVMAFTEVSSGFGEVLETVLGVSGPHLQLLDLSGFTGCDLLCLLLSLESATTLHTLSLSSMGVTDDHCPVLVFLSALQTLDLSLNPEVTALGLDASLPSLQGLRRLNLAGTGFRDDALGIVWGLPKLQELVLADTAVAWEWEPPTPGAQPQQQQQQLWLQQNLHQFRRHTSQEQQQQQQEGVGVDPSGSLQLQPSRGTATGWQSLQVLDLGNARVTDAGCVQLGKQLGQISTRSSGVSSASEADAVGHHIAASNPSSNGLQVLSVGRSSSSSSSSSSKITKKGLAALGKITSLQKLTLQGCQLQDGDLKHLSQLQQLQQLHIQHIDPWLLSDQALQELPVAHRLPNLMLVTRDGKTLYEALGGDPAVGSQIGKHIGTGSSAESPVVGFRSVEYYWQRLQHQQLQQAWLRQEPIDSVGGPTGFGMHASTNPGNSSRTVTPATSASLTTGRGRSKKLASSATPAAAAATVYKRLSEYDERYRYSREDLLRLQQQQQQQQQAWEGLSSIPEWLRASTFEGQCTVDQ